MPKRKKDEKITGVRLNEEGIKALHSLRSRPGGFSLSGAVNRWLINEAAVQNRIQDFMDK